MDGVPINAIAEVIQLAVAPVFLLTGIAGILSVLSHRLSRVVDRTRVVKRFIHEITSQEHLDVLQREATSLNKRTKIINIAIRLSVGSALTVCVVIMCLFIGDFAVFNLGTLIAALFVFAMLLIIFSLLLLILEVTINTRNMHHDVEHLLVDSKK
jgi:hypothetical protein